MSEPNSAKAARKAAEAKAQHEKKKYNIIVGSTVGVLVILVIFALLFSSNLFYNKTTAVEINGVDFTAADFNYYYFTAYNNHYNTYGYYAQLGVTGLMPVAGTPFDEQPCTLLDEDERGKTTWADYFESQALSLMSQTAMLCTEAAKDTTFVLSPEDEASIDEAMESMRTQADTYGFPNLAGYLTQLYGKGMTEKVFRKNLERQTIAAAYAAHKQDSFTYTADKLTSNYTEKADDLDFFLFRSYWFSGAAVEDDEDTEEDETMSLDDAMAKAEEDAKAFEAAVKSEQDFIDYAASLHTEDEETYDADGSTLSQIQGSSLESSIIEDAYKWLIDSARKAGDVTVIGTAKDASSPGFYVLFFKERDKNQYASVNGWYGFIPVNEKVFEEGAEPEDEDEKAAAIEKANLATANEVLATFLNGSSKNVEAFDAVLTSTENAELVTNSAELEKMGKYDGPEDVCAWFFDPARKEGDVAAIFVEDQGTYLLYFSGLDDVYADVLSDSDLRVTDMNNWTSDKLTAYTPDKEWEMALTKNMPSLN